LAKDKRRRKLDQEQLDNIVNMMFKVSLLQEKTGGRTRLFLSSFERKKDLKKNNGTERRTLLIKNETGT